MLVLLVFLVAGAALTAETSDLDEPGLHLVRDALRMLRERAGWSARQLSAEARLSPSYVAKVESGALVPSLSTFAAIVCALGLTPHEVWTLVRTAGTRSPGVTPAIEDGAGER